MYMFINLMVNSIYVSEVDGHASSSIFLLPNVPKDVFTSKTKSLYEHNT